MRNQSYHNREEDKEFNGIHKRNGGEKAIKRKDQENERLQEKTNSLEENNNKELELSDFEKKMPKPYKWEWRDKYKISQTPISLYQKSNNSFDSSLED